MAYYCPSISTFSLRIHTVHLQLHWRKKATIQYIYRKFGTHALVFSRTLEHGNSKNEIRQVLFSSRASIGTKYGGGNRGQKIILIIYVYIITIWQVIIYVHHSLQRGVSEIMKYFGSFTNQININSNKNAWFHRYI